MKIHWKNVLRVFMTLAYLIKDKDPDGLEIRTTMDPSFKKRHKYRRPLHNALLSHRLGGQCNISHTLSQILRGLLEEDTKSTRRLNFLPRKPKHGTNIYIFTDGVWEEGDEGLKNIAESIERLVDRGMQRDQLGIQFIQFGSDRTGNSRLQTLDDDMKRFGVEKDFIDAEHFDGNVFKMLLGSIDPTVDSQSSRPLSVAGPSHSRNPSVLSTASATFSFRRGAGASN